MGKIERVANSESKKALTAWQNCNSNSNSVGSSKTVFGFRQHRLRADSLQSKYPPSTPKSTQLLRPLATECGISGDPVRRILTEIKITCFLLKLF